METKKNLRLSDLFVDTEKQEVFRKGERIKLRKKEYELLEFLARNKDRVINRLTILEYVWNYDANVETNTLEVHMTALRKKLEQNRPHKLFQTVHGRGYKLCDATNSLNTQSPH